MQDISTDLRLEEMDDPSDDDMTGGLQCAVHSTYDAVTDSNPDEEVGGTDSSDNSAANFVEPRCKRPVTRFQGRGMSCPRLG